MSAAGAASLDTYTTRKENDLTLGPKFENSTLINAFLMLRNNEALAREMQDHASCPDKFDDIIVRITDAQQQQTYYCRQLKHKKIDNNIGLLTITWDDLLGNDKGNAFCLKVYFDSYLNYSQKATTSSNPIAISELTIMTNLGFLPNSPSTGNIQTNLQSIAQKYMWTSQPTKNKRPAQRGTPNFITQTDLGYFFEELTDRGIGNIPGVGKRYKFSSQAIPYVTNGLLASKAVQHQNIKELQDFLGLLVFDIGQPHADDLKPYNQSLLRLFFPFHWDHKSQEDCCNRIEKKVLEIFKPLGQSTNTVGKWATVSDRREVFDEFIPNFKREISLGSTEGYEMKALTDLYNKLNFGLIDENRLDHISPRACIFNEKLPNDSGDLWGENGPSPIVNIFSNESNATVIALKLFKKIQDLSLQSSAVIIQVRDAKSADKIVEHCNKLNDDISPYEELVKENFWFIIEVSPLPGCSEETKERISCLCEDLLKLSKLRKWICFLIVSEGSVRFRDTTEHLIRIEDDALNWNDLNVATKTYLTQKTLLFGDNRKTSLKALGLPEENIGSWMSSAFLAELIVYDEKRQLLTLSLPKHDSDLDNAYINRQIQLPIFSTKDMDDDLKGRLTYDEKDYCGKTTKRGITYHLMQSANSKEYPDAYLWLKSNGNTEQSFEEMKPHVIKSKESDYEIEEWQLLSEENNVAFGTCSADNKLVTVVDLPGKGKSFLLSSLTNTFLSTKWKNNDELLDRLLLRINLLEIKDETWQMCNGIRDEQSALDFFALLCLENNSNAAISGTFSSALFKQLCLNERMANVLLLIDGFDEIKEEQRSTIYKLIKHILNVKGIKRIILASRPDGGLEEKLERHFKQFTLHLKNFTEQDQIDFLTMCWKNKLLKKKEAKTARSKLALASKRSKEPNVVKSPEGELAEHDVRNNTEEQGETEIRKYAEALVKFSQTALKAEDRSFLDIPLQCMIVSECFFKDVNRYLKKCQENPSGRHLPTFEDESFDLLRLYDQFYETKVNILFREKARLSEEKDTASFVKDQLKESFSHCITRLSVFSMMKNIDDAQVLCRLSWKNYRKIEYGKDLEQARRLGLVRDTAENLLVTENLERLQVKFIHRTFPEYFFASYLFKGFIETDSSLLDDDVYNPTNILEKTFKIIDEKILVDTEYAGIVRFLNRLLSDKIPLRSERAPFVTEDRLDVLKKWPVVSHVKFNCFLTESLTSYCCWDQTIMGWPKDEKQSGLNELLNKHTSTLEGMKQNVKGAMFNLLTGEASNLPSGVITLLIHCIKEYASRPDISIDQRETIAHSFALATLMWAIQKESASEVCTQAITLFLQSFEAATGLSSEENHVLSKWFFITVNKLTDRSEHLPSLQALSIACSMAECHRYVPNFERTITTVGQSIFRNAQQPLLGNVFKLPFLLKGTVANDYFEIDVAASTDTTDNRDAKELELKGNYFRDVLSLSTLLFPDTSLLKTQVDWFLAQLTGILNSENTLLKGFLAVLDSFGGIEGGLLRQYASYERCINPFAFIETLKFFLSTDKLDGFSKSVDTKSKLLNAALDFYFNMLSRLMKRSHELDKRWGSERQRMLNDMQTDNYTRHEYEYALSKKKVVGSILWLLVVSDSVISYLPYCQSKRDEFLKILTGITRQLLIGFADAACCDSAEKRDGLGFVIYFPSDLYIRNKTRKRFKNWLKDKLAMIWDEKGEFGFIDFLFDNNELEFPVWQDDEDSSCYLPCWFVSKIVTAYIPDKLTKNGLDYLERKMENVKLPGEDPKVSLWDCIMCKDFIPDQYYSDCWELKETQIKILREKIEEKKSRSLAT